MPKNSYRISRRGKKKTTHGLSGTRIHRSWVSVRQRCLNPRAQAYKNYGGRGIKICRRWRKFESFAADMGPMPDGFMLDRIDNNKDYEPSNCRWVSFAESNRNKRTVVSLTLNGRTQLMVDWARELKINPDTLRHRINKGWSAEKVLTTRIFTPYEKGRAAAAARWGTQ